MFRLASMWFRIVNTYSFSRWPADKAYCAKCEGKRHKHGFTAELDDGTLALPGSRCGEKLWALESCRSPCFSWQAQV